MEINPKLEPYWLIAGNGGKERTTENRRLGIEPFMLIDCLYEVLIWRRLAMHLWIIQGLRGDLVAWGNRELEIEVVDSKHWNSEWRN